MKVSRMVRRDFVQRTPVLTGVLFYYGCTWDPTNITRFWNCKSNSNKCFTKTNIWLFRNGVWCAGALVFPLCVLVKYM